MRAEGLVGFVSHNPEMTRNRKLVSALRERFRVKVFQPLPNSGLLALDLVSACRLSSLAAQALVFRSPMVVDVNSLLPFPYPFRKRVVVDVSTPFSVETDWLGYRLLGKTAPIWLRAALDGAKLAIAPNAPLERLALSLGASRVIRVPNFPSKSFKPGHDRSFVLRKLALDPSLRYVAFAGSGRFTQIYGLELMLRAWKLIENKRKDVSLLVIGPRADDSNSKRSLNEAVSRLRIERCSTVGWLSEQDLADALSVADLALAPRTPGFPSEWYNHEDSTKISEYAAVGLPIVATGYLPSPQYLLTRQNPSSFAEGIEAALAGKVSVPKRQVWEDAASPLLDALQRMIT